ncbi:MAG: CHAT domain-containing protein, partial [Anaerolineae bacterium]|nr:CHAT domain-containing protein [Anaerolineae bacterium]
MPKDNENLNILIQIRAWDDAEQAYPVEVTLSDGSHFGGGKMRLDMDRVQEVATDPEPYGLLLFDALFSGPIRRAYDIASSIARREEGKNAALHLWITEKAPELHTLAWEQMHHIRPGQTRPTPLATSAESPLSRYMKLETPSPKPIQKRPIRLLFAISNPSNISDFRLSPLDVPSEITNLLKAVGVLQDAGQLDVTLLPGHTGIPVSEKNYKIQETKSGAYVQLVDEKGQATGPRCQIEPGTTDIDTLIQSLTQDGAIHILHFLGHGSFNPRLGMVALALENKTGTTEWITEEELLAQLPDEGLPYLVFLAACESARRGTQNSNPFVGIAPRLIQAGIPAIVAMQDLVPVTTAREFTHYFYRYLLEHGLVDKAMNQARLMLFEADSAEWAIPTLFMRLEDGRLFTRDPIRSLLTVMADSDTFNPLAPGETYLPLEVLRLSGNSKAMDFYNLQQESMTTSNMMDVIWDIFSAEPDPQIYMLSTKLIALMGDSGMGKSFQLRRIGQRTIRQSLKGQDQQF